MIAKLVFLVYRTTYCGSINKNLLYKTQIIFFHLLQCTDIIPIIRKEYVLLCQCAMQNSLICRPLRYRTKKHRKLVVHRFVWLLCLVHELMVKAYTSGKKKRPTSGVPLLRSRLSLRGHIKMKYAHSQT